MVDNYGCSSGRPSPLTYLGWRDSIAEELARTDPHYTTGSRCYKDREQADYSGLKETVDEAFAEEMEAQKYNEKFALFLLKQGIL